MRAIRVAGVLALVVLLTACGGSGPGPEPSPSASPPVAVRLENIGAPGDTRLGLAMHLDNEGPTRPGVRVRVHIGASRAGDPVPELEERSDAGWKVIALTADRDERGWTGTFRTSMPKGGLLGYLDVTPHAGPRGLSSNWRLPRDAMHALSPHRPQTPVHPVQGSGAGTPRART
ncbi:hypothetical protein [Streptomyces sp. SID2563]|uniref:hypothetical protein n=1 Tax=Streptomyces sp. SID2563 TaxID=2690255 RepID=UPI001F18F450|nr:hypothetical protein [Streptomyces sp. SID2563]